MSTCGRVVDSTDRCRRSCLVGREDDYNGLPSAPQRGLTTCRKPLFVTGRRSRHIPWLAFLSRRNSSNNNVINNTRLCSNSRTPLRPMLLSHINYVYRVVLVVLPETILSLRWKYQFWVTLNSKFCMYAVYP